ncbi:hypothetical protein [Salinicola avicenniae]|uniref:hypothetical protein n=1 Tax=Salinicola avicenniae TaxID=2916836 RepID=UPI00207470F0|nr:MULTISPECIES: hypothetical protein [unclassified Salinicola]
MSTQENDRRSENPARASVSAVLAAMLLWGGWCFFTNAEAPWPARVGMALAQALASGVITGCLARSVTGAMARWGRRPAACWLVPLSVVAVTGSALWPALGARNASAGANHRAAHRGCLELLPVARLAGGDDATPRAS